MRAWKLETKVLRNRVYTLEQDALIARMTIAKLTDKEQARGRINSTGQLEVQVAFLTKQVNRLREMLLDHHEVVPLNDTSGGVPLASKLDVYRGKTAQGKTIHAVRRFDERVIEYHVEGRGVKDA